MRDTKCLVQVEVRDVGTKLARRGQPDERVEVRAVEIDLSAMIVHRRADVRDVRFVHAVR